MQNVITLLHKKVAVEMILNVAPTGKSFSEALILASTKPQYDKILFIELQVQYMKIASSVHVVYTMFFVFVLTFRTIYVHNMFQHVLNMF